MNTQFNIAQNEHEEYLSEEAALEVIDSLKEWNTYMVLPLIRRVYNW